MVKIKTIALLLIISIISHLLSAQVGIFTSDPIGILHLDAAGNNPTSGTPTKENLYDDIVVIDDNNGGISVGIGTIPHTSSELELGDPNKAFTPNVVSLTDSKDITTVHNPLVGMLVYNTSTTYGSDPVRPGLYIYDKTGEWKFLYTGNPREIFSNRRLNTSLKTPICLNPGDWSCPSQLDFGSIIINESGSYAFSLRLYGTISNNGGWLARGIYYVWLLKNGSPVDVTEINIALPHAVLDSHQAVTASVVLGAEFNVNDVVTLKIANYGDSNTQWNLVADNDLIGARTTMFYWKLQQELAN